MALAQLARAASPYWWICEFRSAACVVPQRPSAHCRPPVGHIPCDVVVTERAERWRRRRTVPADRVAPACDFPRSSECVTERDRRRCKTCIGAVRAQPEDMTPRSAGGMVTVVSNRSSALLIRVWVEDGAGHFRARVTTIDTAPGVGDESTVAVAASPDELLDAVGGWLDQFLQHARRPIDDEE